MNFDVELQRLASEEPDGIYVDFANFDGQARAFGSRRTVEAIDIPYFAGTATASSVPATLSDEAALENCVLPSFSAMVTQDDPPAYLQTLLDAFEGSDVSAYAGGLGFDTVRLIGDLPRYSLNDRGAR